jgi:hypothetical protein
MKRFLVLYTDRVTGQRLYAEGLVCADGAVYVRGFYPEEGKLFGDMHHLNCSLRDNEDIRYVHIQMLDGEVTGG